MKNRFVNCFIDFWQKVGLADGFLRNEHSIGHALLYEFIGKLDSWDGIYYILALLCVSVS